MTQQQYQACIDTCNECVQACEECATSCCVQGDLAECTRLCLDRGTICSACISMLSRGSKFA
jgi:hypothetical protein